ncbi:MAG TPA: DEAD/DEAH box helicase [Propionibacteriaceae bacterium]
MKSAKKASKSTRPAGAAKSIKADGTPKKRWSPADRAARGHTPRRGGGLPRSPRREDAPFDREASSSENRSRPTNNDRKPYVDRNADRKPWADRNDDRKPYVDRNTSSDRKPWADRNASSDRKPWADRNASSDRKPWADRNASSDRKPWADRNARSDRKPWADRNDDRKPYVDRNAGSDRKPWADRNDDRKPYGDRKEGGYQGRQNDNAYGDRSDSRPPRRTGEHHQRPTRTNDFTPRTSTVLSRQDRPTRTPALDERELTPAVAAAPTAADFGSLGLPPALVSALTAQGITAPFPIQSATIPDALNGRDILGRGQTGSGKTLAFGLPMITNLAAGGKSKQPRGLVLVPTRELAMQVVEALTPLTRTVGLSIILVAGGMSYTPQLRAFSQGVDIVVATPGRLIDLMDQGAVDLTRCEVTVLDEADHMADLGFMPAVTQILDTVPAGGQRLLFSATLDRAIDRLVKQYLVSPLTHEVDSGQASVTTMAHHVLHIAPKDKVTLTAEIASREGRTVIFVRTQRGADRVAEQLRAVGVVAGALHGGLAQGARTRILEAFKNGQVPVLVATDVAARGIHVDDIGLVLQADPPGGPKEYLHRAGRTARAGGTGVVVTLVLPHQRREINSLTSQAGVRPVALPAVSGDQEMVAATGAKAPTGEAFSESDYQRIISPPVRRRPGGGSDRPRGRGGRDGGRSYGGSRDGERRSARTQHRAYSA